MADRHRHSTQPAQPRRNRTIHRPMNPKERFGVAIAIIAALILSVVMAVNIKMFPYEVVDEDGSVRVTRISLLQKLKQWKPFQEPEGGLHSKEYSYAVKSQAEMSQGAVFDDGLDLEQICEGQFTILFLGLDEQRTNTDVIMLALFDIAANTIDVLQIPRDTFVPSYTSFAGGKINSVYTCGDPEASPVQRVVDCIEETFHIPIDRYITTGCEDIAAIVDLIGGVPIDMPYTIHYEPGKTIYAGTQILSGQQAEWMVRYRQGYQEGDIGRMQAQRIFLAALMAKACEIGSFQLMGYANTIIEEQLIGSNLSVDEIRKLSDFATTIGMERISMFMLPGEGTDYYPEGMSSYYSVWTIHYEPAVDLLNIRFRPYYEPVFDLPVTELLTEGQYLDTTYDNEGTDLENIIGGDAFAGH